MLKSKDRFFVCGFWGTAGFEFKCTVVVLQQQLSFLPNFIKMPLRFNNRVKSLMREIMTCAGDEETNYSKVKGE